MAVAESSRGLWRGKLRDQKEKLHVISMEDKFLRLLNFIAAEFTVTYVFKSAFTPLHSRTPCVENLKSIKVMSGAVFNCGQSGE